MNAVALVRSLTLVLMCCCGDVGLPCRLGGELTDDVTPEASRNVHRFELHVRTTVDGACSCMFRVDGGEGSDTNGSVPFEQGKQRQRPHVRSLGLQGTPFRHSAGGDSSLIRRSREPLLLGPTTVVNEAHRWHCPLCTRTRMCGKKND